MSLWHIVKDAGLRDNPINEDWTPDGTERDRLIQLHSTDQFEAHEIACEFRALADGYGDLDAVADLCDHPEYAQQTGDGGETQELVSVAPCFQTGLLQPQADQEGIVVGAAVRRRLITR